MAPSLITRLRRAASAFNSAPDFKAASIAIDKMIVAKELPPLQEKSKSNPTDSRLDVRNTSSSLAYNSAYGFLRMFVSRCDISKAPHGDITRDEYLDTFWKDEPILAGAVYSMTAKMGSLRWTITGRRNLSLQAARVLTGAAYMGNYGWGGFISSSAEDFYTLNRGFFWELAKEGDPLYASLVDIGHIDAMCCTLTGNSKIPMIYVSSVVGQQLDFHPGEFIHSASLPSPREYDLGAGFCAVDRAHRAAKILVGLHDYDEEKLNNLPPEGVAAVTGLTMDEFNDAISLWMAKREADNSLTFPQVLWLIASQPGNEVKVDFTGFSQVPESFDRKQVIDLYVQTLALDFGVDAREFWAISSGSMGTAAESEIQHMKAKGKGPGEFISTTERDINGELQEGVDFGYDTQDIQEDASAAAVAKAWVDAFMPLYNMQPIGDKQGNAAQQLPAAGKANQNPKKPDGSPELPTGNISKPDTGNQMTQGGGQPNTPRQAEQVIDRDQFLRLLVDKGVLPDYFVNDQRVMITDTQVHNRASKMEINQYGNMDDIASFTWDKGVLKEVRSTITLWSPPAPAEDVPVADVEHKDFESIKDALEFLKAQEDALLVRDIHGAPIPEGEVVRGASVTRATIHAELERWRLHPILSKYAPTLAEEEALLKRDHNT